MARNQVRSNVGQQLKVIQPLLHDSLLLQQQELNTQQPLSINKPIKQTSKKTVKLTPKPNSKTNSLEAPYKTATAKPKKSAQKTKVKSHVKQLSLDVIKKPSLEQQKQQMVEWLENLQIN